MDIDNDGHLDILSGSYSAPETKPMSGYFFVMKGQADGTFKAPEALQGNDNKPLVIASPKGSKKIAWKICTRPTAVDWDGDGKLDIIAGNFMGTFSFFKGEGNGSFAAQSKMLNDSTGTMLQISGAHSDPVIVDWDADGDLDLLSGSTTGGVQWSENIAEKGKPAQLSPFQSLIKIAPKSTISNGVSMGGSSRIWVTDVNGDNKLDITLGDKTTKIEIAKGFTRQQARTKQNELLKATSILKAKRLKSEDPLERQKISSEVRKLNRERQSLMQYSSNGHVWLYLQK